MNAERKAVLRSALTRIKTTFDCDQHMRLLADIVGEMLNDIGPPEVVEPTYHVGQVLVMGESKERFIIAHPRDQEVVLISLEDGNRWASPITVSNTTRITDDEMDRLVHDDTLWELE